MDAGTLREMGVAFSDDLFGVWFLIGAALVFFMQCGFAMVETGFTRAKNAGNIIMKNLMDFSIGTVVFMVLGFGLMMGESTFFGLIGRPNLQIFTDYQNFDWSGFIFNLVFCATTATIVSGAMAERTRFISYCVYSAVISMVIYPIEAHWVWGGGWLAQNGFYDFAGSTVIHMVGGLTALIGASILGARIGKFERDENGKVIRVKAFPGHSLTLGALGVFILWFGWYGFNGAAATSIGQLSTILVTTTIAPSLATFVCMIFTWIRYGKPDVSMCLNASLAGLVAVTAGCSVVDAAGASVIGIVAGLLVVFGVWFLDHVLHVDDPVGAVAVHFLNGLWGGIAVGLFASPAIPGSEIRGLFYGGGLGQLKIQLIGIAAICAWTAVTGFLLFYGVKALIGLRVSEHEEIVGLDIEEHGLVSSYADFLPAAAAVGDYDLGDTDLNETLTDGAMSVNPVSDYVAKDLRTQETVLPLRNFSGQGHRITKVSMVCKQERFEHLKQELNRIGVTGITVTQVHGCGTQKGRTEHYRGVEVEMNLLPKIMVDVIVSKIPVEEVVQAAKQALYTGKIGDGKIFIYDVGDVVRVRTGESGVQALS